jgi:maltose/moltooligosaccharide transporter
MTEGGTPARLSILRILQMNLGFLGLQFSFGLQQANMSPIWGYLGAHEKDFAWLSIAGPLTGFLLPPIVGAMSDRTGGRFGRRAPYLLVGAVICSACLAVVPLSRSVPLVFALLLLLGVGNNVTMQPYRAYVNDRLPPEQRPFGFLSQSAYTGLAQTLAYLSPSILVGLGLFSTGEAGRGIPGFVSAAFWIGAALSLITVVWSILAVPELPLSEAEQARIAGLSRSVGATFTEIFDAIRHMPREMRTLAWMSLFQWFAMSGLWAYANNTLARSVFGTADDRSAGFEKAQLLWGQVGALYNLLAFFAAAFLLPVLVRKIGASRAHALCLVAAAGAFVAMPLIHAPGPMFLTAVGFGLGWGSLMGTPFIIVADAIPPERTGVYMGVYNMLVTGPMILFAVVTPLLYEPLLGGDPRNLITLCGALMLLAALCTWRLAPKEAPHS